VINNTIASDHLNSPSTEFASMGPFPGMHGTATFVCQTDALTLIGVPQASSAALTTPSERRRSKYGMVRRSPS
jgi:hypothetical protein